MSATAEARAARSAGERPTVLALARVEGLRLLRHPVFLAGAALSVLFAVTFSRASDIGGDYFLLAGPALLPLALATLVSVNLAALRSRRSDTEELYASLTARAGARTIAHLVSIAWPAAFAAGLVAAQFVYFGAADGLVVDPAGQREIPSVFELAQGPVAVAALGVLGLTLARWVPYLPVAPVLSVGLLVVEMPLTTWNIPGAKAWLAPIVNPAIAVEGASWPCSAEQEWPCTLDRFASGSVGWHLLYLAGAATVLATVAWLRHRPARIRALAVLAAGVLAAGVGGALQVEGQASAAATGCSGTPPAQPRSRDLILVNGAIVTMDAGSPSADAIALRNGEIVAVGRKEDVLALRTAATRVVDLRGRAVLPGFVDSHAHWIGDRGEAGNESPAEAIDEALSHGWTSVSELFASEARLAELCRLDRAGELRLRVNAYLPLSWQYERFGDWYRDYEPRQVLGPRLRIGGLKLFVDSGEPGKEFLAQPHADDPGEHGEGFFARDELTALVRRVDAQGWQLAAHTMGDAAHDLILDAYKAALAGRPNEARHRIEHTAILRDDQIERIRELGLLASVQLSWFNSDWAEQVESELGPDRARWAGRWRDLLDAGVPVIGGTDHPWGIGEVGPALKAVYQSVTRVGEGGAQPPAWMRAQRIKVEEALRLITIEAAYGTFEEDVKGSLAPGKLADLVVLSASPLEVAPARLQEIDVLATVVGGRVEHCTAIPALCTLAERKGEK